MSTSLIDDSNTGEVLLNSFWGGKAAGLMYQITEKYGKGRYVQFSKNDMLRLCSSFIDSLVGGDLDD